MTTKSFITLTAVCAVFGAARGADARKEPVDARAAPTTPTAPARLDNSPTGAAPKPSTATLPPALAAEKAKEEATRAHIKPSTFARMETPPPAPRAETKPAAPAPDRVWVPGHWAPHAGEWKWVAGQWQSPATPTSVWIEPKYDAATKRWSAGYWQPDRPDSYENEPPTPVLVVPSK